MASKQTSIAIIIPARLDSVRLPNKVLLEFAGLPMIEHVRRRGLMNTHSVPVLVATGDDQVIEVIENFGGQFVRTHNDHADGLSRVSEAVSNLPFKYYIVLQGDEILAVPSEIDRLIEAISQNPGIEVWNQITPLANEDELVNVSVVKCLTDSLKDIYSIFRKSPLTCNTSEQMALVSKICGLFAVSKSAMIDISSRENTRLQKAESIEQIKFIEYGYSIKSLSTDFNFPSINVLEDIDKVKEVIKTSYQQSRLINDVITFAT